MQPFKMLQEYRTHKNITNLTRRKFFDCWNLGICDRKSSIDTVILLLQIWMLFSFTYYSWICRVLKLGLHSDCFELLGELQSFFPLDVEYFYEGIFDNLDSYQKRNQWWADQIKQVIRGFRAGQEDLSEADSTSCIKPVWSIGFLPHQGRAV